MPLFRRREPRAEEPAPPPEPMGREEVARQLQAAAPSVGATLAAGLLPAVRYASRREPDAGMDFGQSKLGGAPDLPRGTPWPSRPGPDGERRLLQFFAQVDLGAAAAVAPAPLGLPTEGQLSFFADYLGEGEGITGLYPWDRDGCVVMYSPPATPLVRCGLRMEPLPSAQLLPLGMWTWPPTPQAPAGESGAVQALATTIQDQVKAIVPEGCLLTGRHQLGGHSHLAAPSVTDQVHAAAGARGATASPAPASDDPWRVILQITSDDSLEIDLGGGAVWFAAPEGDVAAARWDMATFIVQAV